MIRAIEDGLYQPAIKARMQELEQRRQTLEAELAASSQPEPRLHPDLAEVYRRKVEVLNEALLASNGEEVHETIRALIEAIVLVPAGGKLGIEVRGDLAGILALGGQSKSRVDAGMLVQMKLVAGARNYRVLPALVAA
ncbi:MAG TPA: hypothetical protein PKA33_20050, partial [Amaricoccus sp.]|nr:hypothetical protein [Amaricoccus sp.]